MKALYQQDLFGLSKTGKILLWGIEVNQREDGAGIITIGHQTGKDGKSVEHIEVVSEGKNIGKSNETTPIEQAVSQAKSRVQLQLDKGYKYEVPTEKTNTLGFPMPMLAQPLEKIKGDLGDFFFVSPKLNGFRCLALMDEEGEITLYSRKGKEIDTLPHLVEHYKKILKPGDHVDGELYLHGAPLQKIASLVKRYQPESNDIEHHLYDLVSEKIYSERFASLNVLVDNEGPVKLVEAIACYTMEQAELKFRQYREQGYEGAMLRLNNTPYEIGVRSKSLIKMKGFQEEDYRIIDVKKGKPSYKNKTVLEVAILVCQTKDGKEFSVTAPGNELEKHQSWLQRGELIGAMVEVKYAEKVAKTGIPFHPVAIKIKDRELD